MADSPRVHSTRCQMSSELGQYYCWNGQYHEAIKHLEQCNNAHSSHTPSEPTWYVILAVNPEPYIATLSYRRMG